MDDRPVDTADEIPAPGSAREPGPAGSWGGGASPASGEDPQRRQGGRGGQGGQDAEGGHGGEGGYGGGSTGFDDPPEQGLGGETGMSDQEIEEQPRGA